MYRKQRDLQTNPFIKNVKDAEIENVSRYTRA